MSAFLNGFMGGMGGMNQMIGAREDRDIRREQLDFDKQRLQKADQRQDQEWGMKMKEYEDRQANQKAAGVLNLFGKLGDKKTKDYVTAAGASLLNKRPEVLKVLNRNVAEGFEKRVSSKGGRMVKGGIVPLVDTVNIKTGEIVKTGDLSEYGYNDGSDKSLMLSNEGFIEFIGKIPGFTDEMTQIESRIISRGGTPPKKGMSDKEFKQESWINADTGNRHRVSQENGRVIMRITDSSGKPTKFDVTNEWNGQTGEGLSQLRASFEEGAEKGADADVQPTDRKKKASDKEDKEIPGWNIKNVWSGIKGSTKKTRNLMNTYPAYQPGMGSSDTSTENTSSPQPPNMKSIEAEIERMAESNATPEEITKYLKQFDESIIRKIVQKRILSGELVQRQEAS